MIGNHLDKKIIIIILMFADLLGFVTFFLLYYNYLFDIMGKAAIRQI